MIYTGTPGDYGLELHGLQNLRTVFWNLPPAGLIEQSILRGESILSRTGAVVVNTGKHTGRSPNDKFVVKHPSLQNQIWWGKVNQPLSPDKFDRLLAKAKAYLQGKDVFIQDLQAGAHPSFSLPIRLISERAWAALFAYNLFLRLPQDQLVHHRPEFTIFHLPDFLASPEEDGTRTGTVIALDLEKKVILITGTSYAGEIKKSVFTVLNYLLPLKGILSMHCSANIGTKDDVALFFGLSGTGKTTLSSDPERRLVGDDEHGWSDDGIFNFEGGCYAKTIHLRPDLEPLIWQATQSFGAVLENVTCDNQTRELDFDDDHRTENTRGAYPLHYIPNYVPEGRGGHPKNIFFLSADAFGVLPPIARLTPEQAMYFFLSGYTSKLAGTETGLGAEPQTTFSACFGAPFLPLHPSRYAHLLGEKIQRHQTTVWLVNTGWTGGPYGIGQRIRLPYTRALIRAALNGDLANVPYQVEPFFGLSIPLECPGVPGEILNPRQTWADPVAYERQAELLVNQFVKNFEPFAQEVSPEILLAGPGGRDIKAIKPG